MRDGLVWRGEAPPRAVTDLPVAVVDGVDSSPQVHAQARVHCRAVHDSLCTGRAAPRRTGNTGNEHYAPSPPSSPAGESYKAFLAQKCAARHTETAASTFFTPMRCEHLLQSNVGSDACSAHSAGVCACRPAARPSASCAPSTHTSTRTGTHAHTHIHTHTHTHTHTCTAREETQSETVK